MSARPNSDPSGIKPGGSLSSSPPFLSVPHIQARGISRWRAGEEEEEERQKGTAGEVKGEEKLEVEQEDETRRVLCYKERGRQVRGTWHRDTVSRVTFLFSRVQRGGGRGGRRDLPRRRYFEDLSSGPLLRRVDKRNLGSGPVSKKGRPIRPNVRMYAHVNPGTFELS